MSCRKYVHNNQKIIFSKCAVLNFRDPVLLSEQSMNIPSKSGTCYHADDGRVGRFSVAFVCLSVCLLFHTISQIPTQLGSPNLTQKMFHDESWKMLMWGCTLLWVLASSTYHIFLYKTRVIESSHVQLLSVCLLRCIGVTQKFVTGPPTHSVGGEGGQTSKDRWCLSSSSVVVVCNTYAT